MKKNICLLITMVGLSGMFAGCVQTADDHSQFGVPLVPDSATGQYERAVPDILAAARAVLDANGQLTADNSVNHSLRGTVKGVTVYVRVDEVDVSKPLSKITVQARTPSGLADLDVAQYVEKEVALKLQAQSLQ